VETWTWRGHLISYERFGAADGSSAPPLVIVHGFGSSARHFRRLTAALSQHYTVYAPDLLGFGASAKPAVEYTPRLWAAQTEDFLREVVAQPAVLVGNSIGRHATHSACAYPCWLGLTLCRASAAKSQSWRQRTRRSSCAACAC
jgi:pimeloyl-ACP methyl ester carboxylesterase